MDAAYICAYISEPYGKKTKFGGKSCLAIRSSLYGIGQQSSLLTNLMQARSDLWSENLICWPIEVATKAKIAPNWPICHTDGVFFCCQFQFRLTKLQPYQQCYYFKPVGSWIYHSTTHKVNFYPIFTFESVWPNNVYTQCLPRVCDDKLRREFPIFMLVLFVNLTCTTVFDMWSDGMSHNFPLHCCM